MAGSTVFFQGHGQTEQQSLITLTLILIIKAPFLGRARTPTVIAVTLSAVVNAGPPCFVALAQLVVVSVSAMAAGDASALDAVAIYSVGVVDIATLAGPLNPPLLGPLLVSWQQQFNPLSRALARKFVVIVGADDRGWLAVRSRKLVWKIARWRLARARKSRTSGREIGLITL